MIVTVPQKPAAPTITSVTSDCAGRVTVRGTAQPSSTVQVFVDGSTTPAATSNGNFVLTTGPLSPGTDTIRVIATVAGCQSDPATRTITIAASYILPTPTLNQVVVQSGQQRVRAIGQASRNALVIVFANGVRIGCGRSNAGDGSFNIQSSPLAPGTYTITVAQATGNNCNNVTCIGNQSNGIQVTIGGSSFALLSAQVQSDDTVLLEGIAVANSSLAALVDGQHNGNGSTANEIGSFSFITAKLAHGTHVVQVAETSTQSPRSTRISNALTVVIGAQNNCTNNGWIKAIFDKYCNLCSVTNT